MLKYNKKFVELIKIHNYWKDSSTRRLLVSIFLTFLVCVFTWEIYFLHTFPSLPNQPINRPTEFVITNSVLWEKSHFPLLGRFSDGIVFQGRSICWQSFKQSAHAHSTWYVLLNGWCCKYRENYVLLNGWCCKYRENYVLMNGYYCRSYGNLLAEMTL